MRRLRVNFLERNAPQQSRGRSRVLIAVGVLFFVIFFLGAIALNRTYAPIIEPIAHHIAAPAQMIEDSALLPAVLGFGKPFTILLLFQNSGELRPTGGFIGTVGILTLSNGGVTQFWTDDVYRLDGYALTHGPVSQPPGPLARYLRVRDWGIRDANWDPDFPSSARLVVQRFMERAPALPADHAVEHIDAVVAITPELIAQALGVLGPVDLEGRTFTRDTFVAMLQEFVEVGYKDVGIVPTERKGIIGRMARILFERIVKDHSLVAQLIPIVQDSVPRKDLQLFAFDASLESWIRRVGADGSLPEAHGGDSLGVFDANLASFKTDTVMERAIHYTVRGRVATVSIQYTNHGAFTWKTTRYRTYTRVYAPLGSSLVNSSGTLNDDKTHNPRLIAGAVDVMTEHGYTVFGAFTAIEPGHTGTLTFTYTLPESVLRVNPYSLQLLKQSGTGSVPLTLDLEFGKTKRRISDFLQRDTAIQMQETHH